MSLQATVELGRKTRKDFLGERVYVHYVEYRLSPTPFRMLHRWNLPANYELEDYESEDDVWFRKDGQLYNVNEFCTVGMPIIHGKDTSVASGAQLASNGYFSIAAFEGRIYSVNIQEFKTYGYDQL